MKQAIPTFYAEYGRYINRFRAIPYYIDVLKPVERRLLLSLMKIAKKRVKSAKVIGYCIGELHPHGDQSVYQSLVQLVHRGFAVGSGNWGSPGLHNEFKAGAYRYTEVQYNKQLTDLFSEFLPFSEHQLLELNPEPLYLPCIIPIGLIGSSVTSGISFYTTKIPQYSFEDLLKRLIYLIQRENNVKNIIDEPIIKPNITNCKIFENTTGEFKNILEKGEGIIQVVPITKIDTKNNYIIIYGKVPTERGGFSKLKKSQQLLNIRLIDHSNRKIGYKIIVQPITRRKIDSHFELEILKLVSAKLHIKCNVVLDNGKVELHSIDEILLNNYYKWLQCYKLDRQSRLRNVKQELFEIYVIRIIRQILHDNPTVKTIGEICQIFTANKKYQNHNINTENIKSVCSKKSIKKLVEHKLDEQSIKQRINDLQYEIDNIEKCGFSRITSLLPTK